MLKLCPVCDMSFDGKYEKFCSDTCRMTSDRVRWRESKRAAVKRRPKDYQRLTEKERRASFKVGYKLVKGTVVYYGKERKAILFEPIEEEGKSFGFMEYLNHGVIDYPISKNTMYTFERL